MSMFDNVRVVMACPFCRKYSHIEAQTKDLNCVMYSYTALAADWYRSDLKKKWRESLPVAPRFPLDKSAEVWANQAEQIEAEATIPEEYHGKFNFIEIIANCKTCGKYFRGKLAIQDGKLFGEIYDIHKV